MLYSASLEIPAGTPESDPVTHSFDLTHGVIRRIWIVFPPGPRGEAHLAIFDQLHQVLPATPGGSVTGDDITVEFPEDYFMDQVPYVLELRGWSPNATFKHTLTVYVLVEALAAVEIVPSSQNLLERIAGVFAA